MYLTIAGRMTPGVSEAMLFNISPKTVQGISGSAPLRGYRDMKKAAGNSITIFMTISGGEA